MTSLVNLFIAVGLSRFLC